MTSYLLPILSWVSTSWLRVTCITLLLTSLVNLFIRNLIKTIKFRNQINKLPGPPVSNILLGNIPAKVLSLLTRSSAQDAANFYTSQIQSVLGHTLIYKDESMFRLWIGQEPVVCIWKPEVIEQVLSDNFLLEKSKHYDFLRPWLGNGLLTSPGRIWRARRKLLVPSFHFHILQAFVPVFDRKSKLLVRNINRDLSNRVEDNDKDKTKGVVVDITPIITACTLDAICETIMGISIDAQDSPNNEYCQSVYIVGETFLERIIQPHYWLDWMFNRTKLGKLYKYHLHKLHSFTRRVISERKQENRNWSAAESQLGSKIKRLDKSTVESYQESQRNKPALPKAFLDLLLEKLNSEGEQKLSDEEIREEVDTFMFEGHDTTAMALSWTLFLLGHYPKAQAKLQEEVDLLCSREGFNENSDLDLDLLKKLKYLDCVVKEALRLCPSVPFIGRQTTSEFTLANHKVPAGSIIFVLIYQLHRNKDIFPNPELFDPDRFLPENTLGRHPFAYVPFSAGARNCIGQKFAMAEMKSILFHSVRNFTFESVTPMDRARVQMEMVLRPKCALNIRIKSRLE